MVYRPSEGRNQKKQSPPSQPNLVPMMNVFLTLIPFLITMVVITQVALVALNFSSSGGGGGTGNGGGGSGSTGKEIKVVVMSSAGNEMFPGFQIREAGESTYDIRNADSRGRFNFIALNQKLSEIKARNKDIADIKIVVYPDVLYGTLIQTIDLCKKNGFPNVIYAPAQVVYGAGG
jgi:biopolymer transport protein ExbD